jgi:hypothetical protein
MKNCLWWFCVVMLCCATPSFASDCEPSDNCFPEVVVNAIYPEPHLSGGIGGFGWDNLIKDPNSLACSLFPRPQVGCDERPTSVSVESMIQGANNGVTFLLRYGRTSGAQGYVAGAIIYNYIDGLIRDTDSPENLRNQFVSGVHDLCVTQELLTPADWRDDILYIPPAYGNCLNAWTRLEEENGGSYSTEGIIRSWTTGGPAGYALQYTPSLITQFMNQILPLMFAWQNGTFDSPSNSLNDIENKGIAIQACARFYGFSDALGCGSS